MLDRRQVFRSLVTLPAAAWAAVSHLAPRLGASASVTAQDAPGDGESYWNHLRWQFLVPSDQAFFNTGTLGASPRVVLDAVTEHLRYVEETVAEWDYSADQPEWLAGYRPEKRLRQKLADYIHCGMDEVGLTINATMAMNLVAHGIDLAAGDEVLITDKEHPGGRSGWDVRQKRHGVVVKEVADRHAAEGPGRNRVEVRGGHHAEDEGPRRAAHHLGSGDHPAGEAVVRDGEGARTSSPSSTGRRRSGSFT